MKDLIDCGIIKICKKDSTKNDIDYIHLYGHNCKQVEDVIGFAEQSKKIHTLLI